MISRIRDFPSELLIGSAIWKIIWRRRMPPGAANCDGFACYSENIIYMRLGQKPKERFSTFVHEVLHAIDDEYGLDLKHKTIYKLEESIAKLIEDNGGKQDDL